MAATNHKKKPKDELVVRLSTKGVSKPEKMYITEIILL